MMPEEVLIELDEPVHGFRGSVEHAQDGIGEDGLNIRMLGD